MSAVEREGEGERGGRGERERGRVRRGDGTSWERERVGETGKRGGGERRKSDWRRWRRQEGGEREGECNAATRGWRERRQPRRTDFTGALLPITTLALGQSRANRGAASISPFLSRSALAERYLRFEPRARANPRERNGARETQVDANTRTHTHSHRGLTTRLLFEFIIAININIIIIIIIINSNRITAKYLGEVVSSS